MITGVLLAAGKSTRMGQMKQLTFFQEKPLLERSLQPLIDSSLDEIILVLGYQYHEVLNTIKIKDKRLRVVINRQYEKGMSTSIRAAVKSVSDKTEAVIIALGDQPLITGAIIDRLIREFKRNNKGIVAPTYKGRRGNPVMLSRKYFSALAKLTGDEGAKSILKDNPTDIIKVEIGDDSILRDVDYQEDLL